jgi:hypothetical protein
MGQRCRRQKRLVSDRETVALAVRSADHALQVATALGTIALHFAKLSQQGLPVAAAEFDAAQQLAAQAVDMKRVMDRALGRTEDTTKIVTDLLKKSRPGKDGLPDRMTTAPRVLS